jgi:hypothetical protein
MKWTQALWSWKTPLQDDHRGSDILRRSKIASYLIQKLDNRVLELFERCIAQRCGMPPLTAFGTVITAAADFEPIIKDIWG